MRTLRLATLLPLTVCAALAAASSAFADGIGQSGGLFSITISTPIVFSWTFNGPQIYAINSSGQIELLAATFPATGGEFTDEAFPSPNSFAFTGGTVTATVTAPDVIDYTVTGTYSSSTPITTVPPSAPNTEFSAPNAPFTFLFELPIVNSSLQVNTPANLPLNIEVFSPGNFKNIGGPLVFIGPAQIVYHPAAVPEPKSAFLLGSGLLALGIGLRRRLFGRSPQRQCTFHSA